jgi:hypothetical protein
MSGQKPLVIGPFSRWWFYVDYVSERILWHNLRPSRATRGKYRILDGKGESGLFFIFRAPKVVAPVCVD